MSKKAVLLINLGTPDSLSVSDVRKYLREFLMDSRVIDIPVLSRWLLVNMIIAPFRAPKSAKEYEKLFTERGSPLKYITSDLSEGLQKVLGSEIIVKYAMRYQQPSIEASLNQLIAQDVTSIQVIPLFPQYASATTGSVIEKVMHIISTWQVIPKIEFINQFFEEELFIETICDQARKKMQDNDYDHFVFSYHGLPERQIFKASTGTCDLGSCCDSITEGNRYCYRAQCFETTRLLAKKLSLSDDQFTVCFQSRLGKAEWIKPYATDTIHKLADKGIKKVLAFSPAFVSDCLETTIEVGETYRDMFIEQGGEKWDLVESLNAEDKWIDCLKNLALKV